MSTINKDFRVKHGLIVEANTHLNGNLQVDGTITGLQSVTANSVTSNITSFSTTYNGTAGVGQFTWNDGDGTLDLGLKGGEVTIQVGQETVVRVYNDSGSTLTEGEVVYISGSQGNRVAVKRAQANSESSSVNTVGMVTENILNGEEGYVTTSGLVNGLDTSTLTAGLIYLSPTVAGEYTQVKPIAPDHLVIVGYVNRIHATVGSIYIKVDNGYELEELHNVYTANEQNSDLLTYVSANTRWENKSSASIIEPAFSQANTAVTLAQAAFDQANTDGGSVSSELVMINAGKIDGSNTLITLASVNQIVDTFELTTYRTIKYLIQCYDNVSSNVHSTEVLLTHDNIDVFFSEYATVQTANLMVISANVASGNVNLIITPSNANTYVDYVRTALQPRGFNVRDIEGDLMVQSGLVDLETETGTQDLML